MDLDNDLGTHYLNMDFSPNFFDEDEPKVQIQLPYPITRPQRHSDVDAIKQFNEKLECYNNDLMWLSKDFHCVKTKIMNQTFSGSHATITKGLLDLSRNAPKAPFSHCDYNPYYATGKLELVSLDGKDYLVTADCEDNLNVTDLLQPQQEHRVNFVNQTNQPITGLSSVNWLLLLKHSTKLSLIKMSDFNTVTAHVCKMKKEVIDAKISDTQFGVILLDQTVQIFDVETRQRSDCNVKGAVQFKFIDDNKLALLTKKDINIVDLRADDQKVFAPKMNGCDDLCSLHIDGNLLYLGSRHYLIRSDVRSFKAVEFCTHLMKSPPCYIDVSGGYLCLSSQRNDRALFQGHPIGSLPLEIPSICDTLDRCRLQKDLLLRGDIQDRIDKSVGGIKLHGPDLYTVNSLGDVYRQTIGESVDDEAPIEALGVWLNELPKGPKPLYLTNVVNADKVKSCLNKGLERKHLVKFSRKSKKTDKLVSHFKNRYHKDRLSELAANFLAIWDEDEEEDREDVEVPEVAPLDKVSDWIDSQYFFSD